jgi:hypothetical protein
VALVEEAGHLLFCGLSGDRICERLGVTRRTLHGACRRAGRTDLLDRLKGAA